MNLLTAYYPFNATYDSVGEDRSYKVKVSKYTDAHVDQLSFMEEFVFPDLGEVRKNLEDSNYTDEKIEEIITGLKTLPEYTGDQC